ncbi:MAG: glycosyltransferase family 4 protein [Anaerolineae bacterium]|nr:glycosyltransferase family 4 protein [Anaerolineae bacterium]
MSPPGSTRRWPNSSPMARSPPSSTAGSNWTSTHPAAILPAMIGIDARLTYYRTGGISTYIVRLIKALERLDFEHPYVVLHSRKARETLVTRFQRADLWTPCHHRLERVALSVELARFRLALLHSPDFIPPLRGARRHVITVHDLNFLFYPQYLTADSLRYYNGQINTAVEQADHIFADSEATKRDLITMLHVPAEKITVHLLGVDEAFQPQPPAEIARVRAALTLPPAYLLYVGTFEPRKNIAGLIEAYAQLPVDAPPLVLAGNRGWLFEETMQQITRLNLGDRVLWREKIPQADLPGLYSGASALITPSFYEGFGLPALEAMACGTVPIVSDRGSLPEVVGDVGLKVNPDDTAAIAQAINHALSDSGWRDQQRAAGLRRAATFQWEATARTVLSVYQALL